MSDELLQEIVTQLRIANELKAAEIKITLTCGGSVKLDDTKLGVIKSINKIVKGESRA